MRMWMDVELVHARLAQQMDLRRVDMGHIVIGGVW